MLRRGLEVYLLLMFVGVGLFGQCYFQSVSMSDIGNVDRSTASFVSVHIL